MERDRVLCLAGEKHSQWQWSFGGRWWDCLATLAQLYRIHILGVVCASFTQHSLPSLPNPTKKLEYVAVGTNEPYITWYCIIPHVHATIGRTPFNSTPFCECNTFGIELLYAMYGLYGSVWCISNFTQTPKRVWLGFASLSTFLFILSCSLSIFWKFTVLSRPLHVDTVVTVVTVVTIRQKTQKT